MPYSQIAQMTVASAPGTGVITLGVATTDSQTFAEVGVVANEEVPYALTDIELAFECGHGINVGDGTFTRINIYRSSMPNGADPINASAAAIITLGGPSESAVGALQNNLYATAALAEAGTDNTTIMTPLRVAQAIGALVITPIPSDTTVLTSGPITIPSGMTAGKVRLWGAGGGGASYDAADSLPGGSGAPGAYLERTLTSLTPGDTLTLVVGAAGVGGASGSSGGAGGASTLTSGTQTISALTANGGAPGTILANGPPGATATGGDINVAGTMWPAINGLSAGGYGAQASGAGQAGTAGGCTIEWFL